MHTSKHKVSTTVRQPSQQTTSLQKAFRPISVPNTANIVGGHQANLNKPGTSEEAKQLSTEALDNRRWERQNLQLEQEPEQRVSPGSLFRGLRTVLLQHSAGGFKTTINNPQVGLDTKKDAQSRLNQM